MITSLGTFDSSLQRFSLSRLTLTFSSNRIRTEVAWIDFMYAMQSIGFQSLKGAGSTWKFRPPSRFRHLGTMYASSRSLRFITFVLICYTRTGSFTNLILHQHSESSKFTRSSEFSFSFSRQLDSLCSTLSNPCRARLQRRYKMHIDMFVIDNSNRREAATVTH